MAMQAPTGRTIKPSLAFATFLILGYFFIQVAANLTVQKITPIFGSLTVPVGSLLYAVSYTWIDIINQTLGKRNARLLVVYSIFFNALLVAWLNVYIALPAIPAWTSNEFNQRAIEFVYGGLPRIYVASWIANFISENADILIYFFFWDRYPRFPIYFRSAISNSVSSTLDGIVFASLAFLGTLPFGVVVSIAISSAIYKFTIGIVSLPLLLIVRRFWSMKAIDTAS